MTDKMEDAYAQGLEAEKAMNGKEAKDEECLDLKERSEVRLGLIEHYEIRFALFYLALLCATILVSHFQDWGETEPQGIVFHIFLMVLSAPVICWSVYTIIKHLAQCSSRKKNPANHNN